MTDAIILAGGFGTRLRTAVADVPKPLAPVGGKPFLDHQIAWLARGGVTRVVIAAHHLADQVIRFAEDRNGHPLPIDVVRERGPLGTGGAVKNAFTAARTTDTAVVVNGDTYFRFDLIDLIKAHATGEKPVTMAVTHIDDCARYGTVEMAEGKVTRFIQATGDRLPGLVNCGIYMMEPSAMGSAPDGAFSMEYDFFPALADDERLGTFVTDEGAFLDFGTPESYAAINSELGGC